jgi:hypothetical protein
VKDVKGSVRIQHKKPELSGEVTFHLPTLYERIAIGKRVAQLCAPVKWEDLPPDERALTRVVATLEYVIDTAPKGFYEVGPDGGPRLAPGRLLEVDEGLLWEIWAAYVALGDSFRGGGESLEGASGEPGSPGGGQGSEGPGA